jgi:hypothetical protein
VEDVALEARIRILAAPNPFERYTQVRFELARGGPTALRIVDAAGRLVHDRDLGFLDPGFHEVPWDPSGSSRAPLASGVYYLVLESDDTVVATGRAALTK